MRQLRIAAALLVHLQTALCVRPDSARPLSAGSLLQAPGNTTESSAQDSNGKPGVTRWQYWVHIVGPVGAVLFIGILFAVCFRRRGAQQDQADAGDDGSLEAQLAGLKKKKKKGLMDTAIQKQKLEKLVAAIMRLENEIKLTGEKGVLTDSEIANRAEAAVAAADMCAERKLLSALAYFAPIADQSQAIYDNIESRTAKAKASVTQLVVDEVSEMSRDLEEYFGESDMKDGVFGTLNQFEVPSLATLLASACAPAQLKFFLFSNQASAAAIALFVASSVWVLVVDHGKECLAAEPIDVVSLSGNNTTETVKIMHSTPPLYLWYIVDACICGLCLLIRTQLIVRVSGLLASMEEPPEMILAGDPVKELRNLLDYYLTTGADALQTYDEATKSCLYSFSNYQAIFTVIWMIYGTDLVFNTAWDTCHTHGLIVLRIRVLLFLIFIFPILINLAMFFLSKYFESESFQLLVVSTADTVDELLGLGLPIASILAQGLIIRNTKDLTHLQIRRCVLKRNELDKRVQDSKKKYNDLNEKVAKTEEEVKVKTEKRDAEASLSPDDLQAKRDKERQELLNGTESTLRGLNEHAREASLRAEEQVKNWEQGEGPEIFQKMARGEGAAMIQEHMQQVDYAEMQRQAMLGSQEFMDQEWVHEAMAKGVDAATLLQEHELTKQAMAKGGEAATALQEHELTKQAASKAGELQRRATGLLEGVIETTASSSASGGPIAHAEQPPTATGATTEDSTARKSLLMPPPPPSAG